MPARKTFMDHFYKFYNTIHFFILIKISIFVNSFFRLKQLALYKELSN